MVSRNNQGRRKEVEDLSAGKYARRPITTATFAFIILFSGIIIFSVLPLSFFFDPSNITSKIRIGDFPIGMIYQPPQQPELDLQNIPDWLRDILIDLMNNSNPPPNITIPPNLPPMNYIGNGPFGADILVLSTPNDPPHYWRIFTYDNYDGSSWNPTNYTTEPFNYGGMFSGADIYQIRINFTLNSRFSFGLPLPTLWSSPEILNTPAFYVTPSPNITWNLIKNEYGDVFLNISNDGFLPINCEIRYNVTYNPNVNLTYTKQNVKSNPPSQGPSLPGKYLQTPNIPSITPYLQDFLLKMNPIPTTNNTYNTVLTALEYFKTRFYYDPIHTTSSADINRFLINGCGDSKDFATTFAIFLRHLNISTRYVMGAIGYIPVPPWLPLTNQYYWTEVWIPNNTNGGTWVQFDPTQIPYMMYTFYNNTVFPMNTRINDSRMETDHFDLILNANVTPFNPQNRNVNNFELTAQFFKNYIAVNRTVLEPIIKVNYSDWSDDKYLGEAQIKNNNQSILISNFTSDSTVGAHKYNASWLAVSNTTSIIITCNGTTITYINYINGTSSLLYNNMTIIRGSPISLTILGNLTDGLNRKAVKGQFIKIYVNETNNLVGSGYSNESGEFQIILNVSTNEYGKYKFYANFNGSFIANYSEPYPDISVGNIMGSGSNSSEYDIVIMANTSLTKNFDPLFMPDGENFRIYGYLYFDNDTGVPNQIINIYEINSSGELFVGMNTTTTNGSYSFTYFIPPGHETVPQPLIRVNTSINSPYILNSSVLPDPPVGIYVNFTIFQVAPLDPVREVTDVYISGRLVRKDGLFNLVNEQISVLINNLTINVYTITNGTGYFNTTFKVPISITPGIKIVNATTTNESYHIWKDDINWNNITVNPMWINFSIYNVSPLVAIKQVTNVYISGRVEQKNELFNISNEQISILLNNESFGVFTTTNNSGYFATTFKIPSEVVFGNYTINATTTNASYGIFKDDTNWNIKIEELWVNFSISQVSPSVAIKGVTDVNIKGRVVLKNQDYNISNEQIGILLNNIPLNIVNTTDIAGYFDITFKIPNSVNPGNYIINATTTNNSYVILKDDISKNVQIDPIWVNITISELTPTIATRGQTAVYISGRVVHKDQALNISYELMSILLNNISINNFVTTNMTGHFNTTFIIPNAIGISIIPPGNYIINATTTNGNYIILKDDISKVITINCSSLISQISLNYNSFRSNEHVIIQGRVSDNVNQEILGYLNNISMYLNTTLLSINSISGTNTNFMINCTIPGAATPGEYFLNITFNGSGYYLSTNTIQNINIFSVPNVRLSTITPIAVIGSLVIVIGKVQDNNTNLNILGRTVQLRFFNQSIIQLNTNLNGEFLFIMPAVGIGFSFQAYFEGDSSYMSNELPIYIYKPPENYDYIYIIMLIAGTSIGLTIIGYIYHRKRKIEKFIESIQIKNFSSKLKSLLDGQRYKEAVIFLYQIFFSKILEKLKRPPLPGLTNRELMVVLVKKIQLDPNLVYPFLSLYEEARYSKHLIKNSLYSESYNLFQKLMSKSFDIEEKIEIETETEMAEPRVPAIEKNLQV